ncbi:nucleoside triphosphate pyrophosphohydrolase [Tissierella sp.]|uniref:nucleoside triphosphate pyrophosphohydrolase n=1 Tax=Tissierella sp. TaxID=41274 RepID=UPI00285D9547|nr:nucleoside triphosphate pyrophosphohydrolase [Tissierella sp.]MDR7855671.1 nucleoside triphosphate pyrophosphohydrolase [Tissierella sp.]
MGKIYVIGLGPGSVQSLTLGALDRINSGDKNFLRTDKHPTIEYFVEKKIPYKAYDYLYDREDDFHKVYESIVCDLIEESKGSSNINYYVPGNPMVAEKTIQLLLEKGIDIEIVSGMSFIEPMIELVGRDPINGLKIVDGASFDSLMVDINSDMIITQVYNRRILSEVKIILSDIYGDEYKVYLIHSAGVKEDEKKDFVPICELDRSEVIGALTSIYIPKMEKINKKVFDFNDLLCIMRLLRSEDGCPWDMEQTHESIRQSVIEEAYEVVNAIDSGDIDNIIEELGDLLLQVIFHCQIAFDEGEFSLYEVTSALANKLIYRHPHVFSKKDVENSDEVVYNWNILKYAKRDIISFTDKLKDIPKLPALMTSFKIQEKAAEIGFDWEDIQGPLTKVMEEYEEVVDAMDKFGGGAEETEGELGDLLFAVVNLSRFLDVNPEVALNRTINKFIRRFEFMEERLTEIDKTFEEMTLVEMDELWNQAKIHNIH